MKLEIKLMSQEIQKKEITLFKLIDETLKSRKDTLHFKWLIMLT